MTFRTKFLLFVSICVPPNNPIAACGATSFPDYHSFPKWAIDKCNICSRYCIYHVKFTSYCELIECSRPIRFFIMSLMYNMWYVRYINTHSFIHSTTTGHFGFEFEKYSGRKITCQKCSVSIANRKAAAFSNSSGLKSVFEKLRLVTD